MKLKNGNQPKWTPWPWSWTLPRCEGRGEKCLPLLPKLQCNFIFLKIIKRYPPAFIVWNLGVFSGPCVGKWKACTCAMGNYNPSETSLYLDRRLSNFQSWLIAEERRVTSLGGGGRKHSLLQGTCLTSSPYRCPFTLVILAQRVFSILQTSLYTVPPQKSSECS